jgi:hypothetical protein
MITHGLLDLKNEINNEIQGFVCCERKKEESILLLLKKKVYVAVLFLLFCMHSIAATRL